MAAVVSGSIALGGVWLSGENSERVAKVENAQQDRVRVRDVRREAYERFLAQAMSTARLSGPLLAAGERGDGNEQKRLASEMYDELNKVTNEHSSVLILGSEEGVKASFEVRQSVFDLYEKLLPAPTDQRGVWNAAWKRHNEILDNFVLVVRRELAGG